MIDQGPQANGGGGYTRYQGLITGEAGLYKIPGVSPPGRWGYTRYQGSHHWGGGYMKVPSPQHARVGP